jgi:cystathionine gamma-synthase
MSQESRNAGAPQYAPDTVVVAGGRPPHEPGRGVNVALELSTTFHANGELAYARDDNAQWRAVEEVVAALEGANDGVCFASGIATITAVASLVPVGGTVVAPRHPYSGTRGRLEQLAAAGRFTLRSVDISDADAVAQAMTGADWAILESPTNPTMGICDLRAACAAAHAQGARVAVDNTFATPLGQRPMSLGADLVLHSATKSLSGHSDALLGVIVGDDPALIEALRVERVLGGAIAGPFEAMLVLRGLRTLAVRYERAVSNAGELAQRLEQHPRVEQVRYPGLPSDPGHPVARQQMAAFGAIIGVLVDGDGDTAEAVSNGVQLWSHATSLGGVESLIERRARWPFEHPDLPANHLRLSVGIENLDDLWADLDAALRRA